jgi:hypothetical protein
MDGFTYRCAAWTAALRALALVFCAAVLSAQTVAIQARVTVDATVTSPRETCMAATANLRMAVSIAPGSLCGIDYSVSNSPQIWNPAPISNAGLPSGTILDDPSVAVLDPQSNDFAVCARDGHVVVVNRYQGGAFLGWQVVADASVLGGGGGAIIDKSWIVSRGAGELLVTAFVVGATQGGFVYSRSSDSGVTWHADHAYVHGVPVSTFFCVQPTVAADGKVYVARVTGLLSDSPGGGDIRFVVGASGTTDTMRFLDLLDSSGNQLFVAAHVDGNPLVPPAPGPPYSKTVPYLVADPTNINRLFLAYQDHAAADTSDVDIYVVRLDYSDVSHAWSATTRVRVNTDPVLQQATQPVQFTPAMAIDGRGRIHVIFYDNRACCPNPCSPPTTYRVYYALSTDHGASFSNQDVASLSLPAITVTSGGFSTGEYSGITIVNTPTEAKIWTSYTGYLSATSSLIYGTEISVSYP